MTLTEADAKLTKTGLGPEALCAQDQGRGDAASPGGHRAPATRTQALTSLLADPGVRRQIGSAWPLYVMLALDWRGSVTGTRDGIAGRMGGEIGRNVGNWVDGLVKAKIATVHRTGRRMTVALGGEHMEAARMPDAVTVVKEAAPAEATLDDRQRYILGLFDDAREMGCDAEIRIAVKAK